MGNQYPLMGPPGAQAAYAALAARSKAMNAARTNDSGFKSNPEVMNVGKLAPAPTRGQVAAAIKKAGPINWASLFKGNGKGQPSMAATDGAHPDASGLLNGLTNNPGGTIPNVPSQYPDLFQNILNSATALYNQKDPAAKAVLNPNAILKGVAASEINPNQVGNDAGLSYDALIDQLNRNYGTTQNQNAQNIADIGNWFAQAEDTQKAGAAANAKDFAAQLSGSDDAAKAFMAALGGDASPASAGIANAAAIASAGLRGEGLANTNFDTNMAGLVALDKAQSLRNEKTAGTNRLADLLDQIAQAQGQKAGAVAQARDNAQQTLFGQKSSLANLKSNLSGNVFNELEGLRQQKLSELSGLTNTALGTALAGPQIQGAELANQGAAADVTARKLSNIGIAKQVAALGGAGNADISQAQPGTRQQIQQIMQGRFLNPNGTLRMSPKAIPAMIASELSGVQGWANNPSLRAFAAAIYKDIVTPNRVSAYSKSHKK